MFNYVVGCAEAFFAEENRPAVLRSKKSGLCAGLDLPASFRHFEATFNVALASTAKFDPCTRRGLTLVLPLLYR
jgi:hypothetical protein